MTLKTIYLPPDFDPRNIAKTMEEAKLGLYDDEKPGYVPAYCDEDLNAAIQLGPGMELTDEIAEEIEECIDRILDAGDGGYGIVAKNNDPDHEEHIKKFAEKMGVSMEQVKNAPTLGLDPSDLPEGEEFNGIEGDACPCKECHERRKAEGPDETIDRKRPPSDPYHQPDPADMIKKDQELGDLKEALINLLPPGLKRDFLVKHHYVKDPVIAARILDIRDEIGKLVDADFDGKGILETLETLPPVMELTSEAIHLMTGRLVTVANQVVEEAKKLNIKSIKGSDTPPQVIVDLIEEIIAISKKLGLNGFIKQVK